MKRTALALMVLPLLSTAAFATGYTGPGATPQVTTVAAALEAADDTHVVLEGQIVKRLQDELYEFKDAPAPSRSKSTTKTGRARKSRKPPRCA